MASEVGGTSRGLRVGAVGGQVMRALSICSPQTCAPRVPPLVPLLFPLLVQLWFLYSAQLITLRLAHSRTLVAHSLSSRGLSSNARRATRAADTARVLLAPRARLSR